MKNFSYAQDFDSLSTIVEHTIHLATPIQSTSYSVDVGERVEKQKATPKKRDFKLYVQSISRSFY